MAERDEIRTCLEGDTALGLGVISSGREKVYTLEPYIQWSPQLGKEGDIGKTAEESILAKCKLIRCSQVS